MCERNCGMKVPEQRCLENKWTYKNVNLESISRSNDMCAFINQTHIGHTQELCSYSSCFLLYFTPMLYPVMVVIE